MQIGPGETEIEAYVKSAGALLALPITPDWHPTVLANMKTIAAAAALLHQEPIGDTVEAAPIFQP